MRRVGNTNLYFMPAGTPVKNPLELLNLRHVRTTIEALPKLFNWFIIDTPPAAVFSRRELAFDVSGRDAHCGAHRRYDV